MSVFRSKSKTKPWKAQVAYTDATGSRKFVTRSFKTKREAISSLRLLKKEALAKSTSVPQEQSTATTGGLSLGQLYRLLGPIIWRDAKSGRSKRIAESRLQRCVSILGDDLPVAEITTNKLDELVTALLNEELSGATVNRYLNAINRLLKAGYSRRGDDDERLVPALPDEIPWQYEGTPRSRWLSDEEYSALFEGLRDYKGIPGLGDAAAAFVLLAIKTGARRGDLLGVDPSKDLMVVDGEYIVVFRDPKNSSSRSVYIDAEAFELFRTYAPWGKKETGSEDFASRFYVVWRFAKKAMGLEKDEQFVPHCLRHTHATYLVEAGENIRVIQEQLGHKQIQTTQRYAHVTDKARKRAAATVLSRLDGLNTKNTKP